jgi:osmotically inducible protein OsmC
MPPDWTATRALALVEKAHLVCPYSNATRGNVEVTLTVI